MKKESKQQRDHLVEKLDNLVGNTEKVYMAMGNDFPLLLEELDLSLKQSSNSAENIKEEGTSFENIDLIINEGNDITDRFNKGFSAMYERDGELFKIIKEGVSKMGTLEDVIDNIKEGSIEMELISLNAMTVALKSGTAGKAFSFITDELKKLSAQTIRLTDELTASGQAQLIIFKDFGEKIEKVGKDQQELKKRIEDGFQSSFTALSRGLIESTMMMETLAGGSVELKSPLIKIMQEIQLQDIIRQSIDHIYISLEEFHEYRDDWSQEKKLDELAYHRLMPDLCLTVLQEVKTEIDQSCLVFSGNSQIVDKSLHDLEDKRSAFVSQALKKGESGRGIISLKEESARTIDSLIDEVKHSVKFRKHLSQEGLDLLTDINLLKKQFESFEPIISRFQNIIVASRIEVAKQSALSDMEDTVIKMTELTIRIEEEIAIALETIKVFLHDTESIISNYWITIKKEMPNLRKLLARTDQNKKRMEESSNSLIDCLKDFRIFTPRFYELFEKTTKSRRELENLEDNIEEIEELLKEVKENALAQLKRINGDTNVDDWTIRSEKLNGIIEKFTIFTHKQKASELSGGEVAGEETAESGEVTLF